METKLKIIDNQNDYSRIDAANLETYLSAEAQVNMLKTMIIEPFEKNIKKDTGYSKEKRPTSKKTLEKRIGSHNFKLEVKPTKNPKYSEVYDEMDKYFTGLGKSAEDSRRRDGIRNTQEGTFVLLEDIADNLNKAIEKSFDPGVEIKIIPSKGKDSEELTRSVLEFDYSRDYGALKKDNARDYIEAKKIVSKANKVILKPFDGAVKARIGFSRDNMPADVVYSKNPIGDVLCYVVSSPASSVSYGKVIGCFSSYVGGLCGQGGDVKMFNRKAYVSLKKISKGLESIKAAHTSTTLRQSVSYLKRPQDDKIIIE